MILLLGSKDFYQATQVQQKLAQLDVESHFLDFAADEALTIEFDEQKGFTFQHQCVDLQHAKLAWRASKFVFHEFGDTQAWADEFVAKSMQRGNYSNFISIFPGKMLNPVMAQLLGSRKLWQLNIARAMGFKVPRSIITNSHQSIHQWRGENDALIIKGLNDISIPVIDNGVKSQTLSTAKLDIADLGTDNAALEPFHVYVQENIEKKFEHRCVYVAGRIFNFKIDPKQHPIMETDYRFGGMMVNYVPHELPADIAARVQAYANHTGLFSGCFDFIENQQGEFVFLEVNPEGVWGRHDDILEGQISQYFAEALLREYKSA